ncbi:MAG: DNA-binding response regulator [Calditrichaeota bacterium]|nr:MAG: DNA-binding response regulator [Calditrichota bacterium]
MNEKTVLMIEDDVNIVDLVEIHLKDIGLRLDKAYDGLSGLEKALSGDYALIILDLMLPHMDGLEVCRRYKQNDPYTPILMLTAKSEELDKVIGLESGADDYLTKPFGVRELTARVKAILRRIDLEDARNEAAQSGPLLCFDGLTIDRDKHKVIVNGRRVELTAKEFDLLTLFASHPGNTYSRERLLSLIWGDHYEGYEHTVSSHINRLRNKIESDPTKPKFIKTLWGVGYRFDAPGESDE